MSKINLRLKLRIKFYAADIENEESVLSEYRNLYAMLYVWEYGEGQAVPRDHEDLLKFLLKYELTSMFPGIINLLKISLTLPISSAHDERAFSCLKRIKTYLRSKSSEKRLSNSECISINREILSNLETRKIQQPFLNSKTRRIFN